MTTTHKKKKVPTTIPGVIPVKSADGISEFILKSNGLRILHLERPGTGVITTNIMYVAGSRDEARGETGAAHMLEHMLFKPTIFDLAENRDAAAMQFERDTGCVLNANTWRDRTTYFFSYPKEQVERALRIEAERMTGVVLTDESLDPERNNVLSEHDMYNGDPYFALGVAMSGAAYHSHPYGHETIGHREDIVQYSAAALERFYRQYYRPDNAVLMIIGDIDEKSALTSIKKIFGGIERPHTPIPRHSITEPKQEGLRRTTITRPSQTNIVSLGVKLGGFPSEEWYVASALFEILTAGPESILHKELVDTGIATQVDGSLEPSSEEHLAAITITLAKGHDHATVENLALSHIHSLKGEQVTTLLKKVKAKLLTDELFARDNSLRITQELTEFTAAGDWTFYTKTPDILAQITPKQVTSLAAKLFTPTTMTIGYFIGSK